MPPHAVVLALRQKHACAVGADSHTAEELLEWISTVNHVQGLHIHDLEAEVAAQAQRGDANDDHTQYFVNIAASLQVELAQQTQRGDANEARCKDLKGQLQDLQGQLAEQRAATAAIEAVENRAASLQVELAQQTQRGDANEARCKDLEGQLHDLQGQLAEQREASERASTAVRRQAQRGDASEARCKDLERQMHILRGQLQDLQGQLTRERAQARASIAAQRKLTEMAVNNAAEEAAKVRDAETRAAEKIEAVENRAASLQVELAQQTQRGDANEARCKDLEGQLQDLQGQLVVLRAASERAATAAIDAVETRAASLQVELAQQTQRGDASETRCKDLERQMHDLQGQLAEQREASERAATAAQRKLTEMAVNNAAEEAAKVRDAETRAAEKIEAVENRAASLQVELAQQTQRGDANEARCKDLEGQLHDLQGQLAEQLAARAIRECRASTGAAALSAHSECRKELATVAEQAQRGDASEERSKDPEGQLAEMRTAAGEEEEEGAGVGVEVEEQKDFLTVLPVVQSPGLASHAPSTPVAEAAAVRASAVSERALAERKLTEESAARARDVDVILLL